jgi:heterodisulfide reductase subunit A-like polyferredoxin
MLEAEQDVSTGCSEQGAGRTAPNMDGSVVGAVMVVGGGIAGMQASLDLADAGYKVFLVEKQSAIGGHMAQLDKTFPTNDCAMCTISPRLVEVGRHPDIELLTESEVVSLEGEAGDFTARIRTRARYIDTEKCNGCGACAEACPVPISNDFNLQLDQRRAAFKLYPQATPNAYAIDKRGVAPCRDACPAGQRAQGYIALIREGRIDDAMRTIKEDNPFPAICGRVCNRPCETACSRAKVDEAVNIRGLKRYVTDTVYAKPRVAPEPVERRFEERIAIIGAGPCGLTAAQDLCRRGYGVTVFEALPTAGGMLRFGVPEYRLPAAVVDREVQDIVDLGVELRTSTPVTNLDDLFAEGFSSVLIAAGAQEGIRLGIPGANLDGVLINTRFLRDVRLAELDDEADDPRAEIEGKRVLVIGGGDVAMDVARTAVRLDAAEVHMACLESGDAIPASKQEIREALEEGVQIHDGRTFLRVVDDGDGHVAGVECQRVEHFAFGADGRLNVQAEEGSDHVLPADVVIFSVGQRVGLAFLPEGAGVQLAPNRAVAVDSQTFATGRPGVFAAGDSTSGTSFVIEAVASGHRSADAIHGHLRGELLAEAPAEKPPVAELSQSELDSRVERGEIERAPRVPSPEREADERRSDFGEIEAGYTEEQASAEAARCLSCGVCSECMSCFHACGVDAVDLDMPDATRDIDVGAVILAPGFEAYRAELSEEYGLGRYPNVVSSLQYERLLSASGPTAGKIQRPSDDATPKKIAFLQCVGSRDATHDYCSTVCCMYAAKQAVMTLEHEPDTQLHVFMMDMRAFGKNFESYYQRAREKLVAEGDPRERESGAPIRRERHGVGWRQARAGRGRRVHARGGVRPGRALGRHGDLRERQESGAPPRHPARRARVLQHGAVRSAADQPTRHLRGRPIPRATRHLRVDRRGQRGGRGGGRDADASARFADPRDRVSAGARCDRGRAAHCGLRVPLRLQHRRLSRRHECGRIRQGSARCGSRRGEHLHLLAGLDRPHHREGEGAGRESRDRGQLHAAHPLAAVREQHPRRRSEPPSLRDGEHSEPVLLGERPRLGSGHLQGQGSGAHGGGAQRRARATHHR